MTMITTPDKGLAPRLDAGRPETAAIVAVLLLGLVGL
jgi:hypothetical protein